MDPVEAQRRAEQAYLDRLYARLDDLRRHTEQSLAAVRRSGGGSPQNRSERDAFATLHEQRLSQLRAVEDRLCFGRLDLRGGTRRYVGRVGLSDDQQNQLLVDWRAPVAAAFYQATPRDPRGVVRRRHLATQGRTVTGLEDEVLDLDALPADEDLTLSGEGALLAALDAHRTGRMADIVATIQAEQDRVIRSDLDGVLVVQGGPGTGKTAVALHRAAYLLYTHRERLARSGVLVVGPNPVFLRYIERVLPGLGETGVVMTALGDLLPGVVAEAEDPPALAALKGDLRMAGVVAAAVRARQRVPDRPLRLDVDGTRVVLHPEVVRAARDRARASRRPHNRARTGFARELLDHLAGELAEALELPRDGEHRGALVQDLRAAPDVRREINLAWMPLTPQQLLADLYADPDRLAAAARRLRPAERELLARERGAPWTVADVPLLDEAAQLLGEDDTAAALALRQETNRRQAEVAYAREVLARSGAGRGLVSAELLADRFTAEGPLASVAERAAGDREWAYGHVVVDEAQELSPMAWRMLMRRCPRRSFTVVGDLAQTGSAAGARSWADVLDPHVAGRWRLAELTVNYRTPREIMDLATAVLAAAGEAAGERAPAQSARAAATPPVAHRVAPGDLPGLVDRVREELDRLGAGRLAVLTSVEHRAPVLDAVRAAVPADTVGTGVTALDRPVAVLGVREAKGLEFDTVVLHEPTAVLAESPVGAHDLYVALTRPTQRLVVVHSGDLPPGLDRLADTTAAWEQPATPSR